MYKNLSRSLPADQILLRMPNGFSLQASGENARAITNAFIFFLCCAGVSLCITALNDR